MTAMRFETRAVHAGGPPDPATGAVAPPIHLSTTFEHGPAAETPLGYIYIRDANPTQARLEDALAALEGGEAALVFALGHGAPRRRSSRRFPPARTSSIPNDVYYGVRALARGVPAALGHGGDRRRHGRPRAGPRRDAADDARSSGPRRRRTRSCRSATSRPLAAIAHDGGARLAVDATFATPALQRPLELGADVVHPLDDEVPRRPQRRPGRRARVSRRARRALRERSRTCARSSAASPRRSTRGSSCAACARSPAASSASRRTPSRSRASSSPIRPSRPCTTPGSPRSRATRSRGARCPPSAECCPSACAAAATRRSRRRRALKVFVNATSLGGTESLIEHRASSEGPSSPTPPEPAARLGRPRASRRSRRGSRPGARLSGTLRARFAVGPGSDDGRHDVLDEGPARTRRRRKATGPCSSSRPS